MNFLARMLDMLTTAYARKPESRIGKLYMLLASGLENAYNTFSAIRLMHDIHKAEGATLDRWGLNLGVSREGAKDPFYRLMLMLKMMALLSGGDTDTIIQVISTLFDIAPTEVEYCDKFPAKIWAAVPKWSYEALQVPDPGTVTRFLKRIVAAGVWFKLYLKEDFHSEGDIYAAAAACITESYTTLPYETEAI